MTNGHKPIMLCHVGGLLLPFVWDQHLIDCPQLLRSSAILILRTKPSSLVFAGGTGLVLLQCEVLLWPASCPLPSCALLSNPTHLSFPLFFLVDFLALVILLWAADDSGFNRILQVVGADGAGSQVRGMSKLRTVGWDYDQRALVATVRVSFQTDTAWQRFLPTGPIAMLPVRDGFCNIVWSTTPALARQMERAAPEKVVAAVNEVGRISLVGVVGVL